MNALLEQFLTEGRDLIRDATRDLVALEWAPGDAALLAQVFRAFHTLKGSSGVFDLPAMTRLLHGAEDTLAAARAGRRPLDGPVIDTLLEALDRTARWLDDLETRGTLDDGADLAASDLVERLGRQDIAPTAAAAGEAGDRRSDPDVFTSGERRAGFDALGRRGGGAGLFRIAYEPDPQCFFTGEDPLKLVSRLPGIAALRVSTREPWPEPDALDPFICNLRIDMLAVGTEAEVRHPFRLVADRVRVAPVAPEPADHAGSADIVGAILAEQRRLLDVRDPPAAEIAGRWGAAGTVAANALRHEGRTQLADTVLAALARSLDRQHRGPLAAALDDAVRARQPQAAPDPVPAAPAAPAAPVSRLLRIDEDSVDRLFALTGELIVAKNSLGWLAGRAETDESARPLRDLHATMDRLTRSLHDAVVRIRAVPVGQVFDRFPRLVRDLSRRLGKPVDLVIRGEGVRADKAVVEGLYEPLLHLIRNCLDHGIEMPEERRRHAKPDRATLVLRATHADDRLVVEVEDDGQGIDLGSVGRKAVAAGLIDEEGLAALDPAATARLIFAPGLSTMEDASDLSGRGIGMYAVRVAVEQVGGSVGVDTIRHRGTTVRLELPLALALMRIVTVRAGTRRFGIPLDGVAETVRLKTDRIRRVRMQSAFAWRDQVIPLHSLARLLDLHDGGDDRSVERMVLVVRSGDGAFGLEVDAIEERQEVALRPMDGLLADIPAYLGTTLLGDGQVLLVLNVRELAP